MEARELTFFALMLTGAFIVLVLSTYAIRVRHKPLVLRPIAAYQRFPMMVDQAVESGRRLHISLGASSVGQESTLTTLAAADILFYLSKRQAFVDQLPLVTLSDPVTLALAQDTLRKAYMTRENLPAYRSTAVVWYPHSERSIAFGAGIATLAAREAISGSILLGNFGKEIAFLGETATRRHHEFIGQSTQLEGQAVAYVQSSMPLIGEELFVGEAYLNPKKALAAGSVMTLDILRWATVILVIIAVILKALD